MTLSFLRPVESDGSLAARFPRFPRFRERFAVALAIVFVAGVFVFAAKVGAQAGGTVPVLTSSDVQTARGAPISSSQWTSSGTTALGTAPAFPFAAEIAAANRVGNFVVNIRIFNRHASQYVCFAPFARTAACSTVCAASGLTCSGAATDGDAIGPGSAYTTSLTGTDCSCWVASGASTAAGAARVARYPN